MAAVLNMDANASHHIGMEHDCGPFYIEIPIPLVAKGIIQLMNGLAMEREHSVREASEILLLTAQVEGQSV